MDKELDSTDISNQLKDKSFTIYIYDGVNISVDVEPKKSKELLKFVLHKPKEEAKENFINMQIYDINCQNKHSSSIEITQSALSSIGCEISKVEITKFHTNEINNSKISNLCIQNNEFVESFGLSTGCKGEKLSKEQLDFLRKELESKDYTVNEISIKYGISPSTVRNIKNNSSNQIRTLPLRRYDKISEFQRNSIKQNIMQYYIEVESEFNSVDDQKYLFEKCDIICSLKVIRDIMKNDLNFTYKKCCSRSNIVDFDKVKALRILFSARLSIQLKEKNFDLKYCRMSNQSKHKS